MLCYSTRVGIKTFLFEKAIFTVTISYGVCSLVIFSKNVFLG